VVQNNFIWYRAVARSPIDNQKSTVTGQNRPRVYRPVSSRLEVIIPIEMLSYSQLGERLNCSPNGAPDHHAGSGVEWDRGRRYRRAPLPGQIEAHP
jgi:hypothetical protein